MSYETLRLLKDPLLGGLVALATSAVVLAVARRRAWAGGLALGAGYLAGHAALGGMPGFPPHDAVQRLFYVGVLAVAAALVLSFRPGRQPWRRAAEAAALLGAWLYLIPGSVRSAWTPAEAAAWLSAIATAGLTFWFFLDDLWERRPGPVAFSLPPVLALAAAAVLSLSHSALLGQLAGLLAAALVPGAVWAWRTPAAAGAGLPLVLAALLPGLWVIDAATVDAAPVASLLLLAAVPAVVSLGLRLAAPRARTAVPAAAALVPVVAALALVLIHAAPADDPAGHAPPPPAAPVEVRPGPIDRGNAPPPAAAAATDENPFRPWADPAASK